MEEIILTEKELYNKKIADEFERLKNLPKQQEVELTPEEIQQELENSKQQRYEAVVVSKIRKRYSINQELAILRQRDTKPEEYFEYNAYVEQCKAEAKVAIYEGE